MLSFGKIKKPPSFDELVCSIMDSQFFSLCGGPYPDDDDIRPISFSDAESYVIGMYLDSFAHCELDRRLCDALNAERENGKSYLIRMLYWISGVSSEGNGRMDYLGKIARKRIQSLEPRRKEWTRNIAILREHVETIIESVGWLCLCGYPDGFDDIVRVYEVAISGFLPVDIARKGDNESTVFLVF